MLFTQHIHKKHHEFKEPTALAAVYAHPVEVLLSNLLPLWLGPCLVLHSHVATWFVWVVVATAGTQYHHAGYRLIPAWLDHNPDFHNSHHTHFDGNYGLLYVLDWVFRCRVIDVKMRMSSSAAGAASN